MSPLTRNGKRINPYYPDIQIFLILIPLISAFNYYLTYSNIRLNGFLLLTFSIDTIQGYLAWLGVRQFILYLDKKRPYEQGLGGRLGIQVAGSIFIGLLIISLLTELTSWIAKGKPAPLHFYTRDMFIIGIWFFVINGIYVGLHFYREWQGSLSQIKTANQLPLSEDLIVRHGKQDIRLAFQDLAGFFVDGDYAVACHLEGKKYYLDESLDKIEQKLPETLFFRLNRQFLLHRQMISGFRRAENRKIVVLVRPSDYLPAEIPVSREKAPAFKSWFQPA